MRRLRGKLAFVHRTLWARDHVYRWAVLLGPPPLFGIGLAALVLAVLHARGNASEPARDAPWAHWTRPVARDGQPFSEPTAPLPQTDASGRYVGFEPGWRGVIQPLSIDATMNPTINRPGQSPFTLSQPTVPLARIVDAAPPTGLFVGTVNASFVVQTPGEYGFSARLARSGTLTANCLLWLETPQHRMLRNLNLETSGQAVINYETTEFRLERGLLRLLVATGCWRGDQMVGAGEVTVMVRRPGQTALQAAAADELISPAQK